MTGFGKPSTRSLASFKTQAGDLADHLDDVDLLGGVEAVQETVNSVFSAGFSAGAAATRARGDDSRGGGRLDACTFP